MIADKTPIINKLFIDESFDIWTCSVKEIDDIETYATQLSRDMTKKQQNECAPSEDSDQPGHPPSLIRVFAVRSMGG